MKNPIRFVASLLAGVSLGMLFAPKKGKELRKDLLKSGDKIGEFGKQFLAAAKDAGDEVQKLIQTKEVQALIASGKSQLDDFLEIVKKKGQELSAEAQKEIHEITKNLGIAKNKGGKKKGK